MDSCTRNLSSMANGHIFKMQLTSASVFMKISIRKYCGCSTQILLASFILSEGKLDAVYTFFILICKLGF